MENLIVCVLLYVVAVAICYQPRHTAATETPIDYFPQPEPVIAVPTPKPQQPKPVTVTEPLPAATFKTGQKPSVKPVKDLSSLSIRQLYAEAKAKGIKRYKSKSKAVLLSELKALG